MPVFFTLWGGGAQKWEKQGIEKCAFPRGRERTYWRDNRTRNGEGEARYAERMKERQTLDAFINRCLFTFSAHFFYLSAA